MNCYTIAPPLKLAEYIQFFWVLEGSATAEKPFFHRVLAESSPEWIFYCKGQFETYGTTSERQKTFSSGIAGQMQGFKKLYTSNDFCLFGVYLFPYAIPGIFGLPAHALSEQAVDTGTLLGREGQVLEQKNIRGFGSPAAGNTHFTIYSTAAGQEPGNGESCF